MRCMGKGNKNRPRGGIRMADKRTKRKTKPGARKEEIAITKKS